MKEIRRIVFTLPVNYWTDFVVKLIVLFLKCHVAFLNLILEVRINLGDLKNRFQRYHSMMAEAPVMDNEVYNHYLTCMTPAEFAEHLKDSCPEFGDLNVQELLLMQVD